MAIGSKKSLGKNSMYVQAKKGGKGASRKKSGSTSLKSTGRSSKKSSSTSNDSINTNAGNDFYSKFKDTSLESQLTQRGFSSMRPEIVGAFEFIPPVSSDVDDVSQKEGQVVYDTTSSGELIDMQTQLKALRCSQTMSFLIKKIGLKTNRRGYKTWWRHLNGNYTDTVWKPFFNEMVKAKSVLDFLSAALLLTDFATVTDIKLNRYLTVNNATGAVGHRDLSKSVAGMMKMYSGNFIKNKAPGKMSLNEYLTTFLQYPEEYLQNVSSSALMMQLLADTASRIIYPKTSFSNLSTPSGDFGPMCLPGVSFKSNRDYRVTTQLSQLVETIKIIGEAEKLLADTDENERFLRSLGISTPAENPLLETEETGTDYFTKGDFFELWTVVNDRKNPKPLYIVARDFMNHCAQTALAMEPGSMPTRTSTKNSIKSLLGFNPFSSYDNIADIKTSSGDVIGLNAFRKSIGDNTVVATFNEGWGDTESGDISAITGQSYFVDDFFKNGSAGVKEGVKRFADLKDDLKQVKRKLYKFIKPRIAPKVGLGASFANTVIRKLSDEEGRRIKYQSDYSGPEVQGINLVGHRVTNDTHGRKAIEGTGTFFQRIWNGITREIYFSYADPEGPLPSWAADGGDGEGWYGEAVQYQVFMAAALDRDVAWAAFRWYLAYENNLIRGTESGAQTTDESYDRLVNESRLLTDEIWRFYELGEKLLRNESIKFYGNGYDADEAPFDMTYEVEGSPGMDGFESSPALGGIDPQATIDRADEGDRLRTDYSGAFKDSFLRPGDDYGQKEWFLGILTGNRSDVMGSDQPLSIFKEISSAVEDWEKIMIHEYGVEEKVKAGAKTTDLKIDKWGRVIMGYMIALVIFRESLTLCHVRPPWVAGMVYASDRIDFGYSRRAVNSLGYTHLLKAKSLSRREGLLAADKFGPANYSEWTPGFYSTNSDGLVGTKGVPYGDAVRENLEIFYTYHIPLLEWDMLVWNNLYYIIEVIDLVEETIKEIVTTFSEAGSNDLISQMKKLQDDPDLSDQIFDLITPEQVRLARYVYDSLSSENRKYPYLPAASGIVPNTPKNLGTLFRLPSLVDTDGIGDKRIFAIGLPAGLVEFLRRSASRSLMSSDFNTSSIVKLSIWRRNLLTETTAQLPVEYLFDVKRFMLDGRRNAPKTRENTVSNKPSTLDSAVQYFKGQTINDLFKNACICKYTSDGIGSIYKGTAYSSKTKSIASKNGSLAALSDKILPTCINYTGNSKTILDEIFYNHVVDYYLKQYLKLTSGIDLREEVFCFKNEKTEITGPDENKASLRKEWEQKLRALFETRDIASSLTYQRMLGELDRSIFLSPEKYKNRIIYPKIFDRVFCIYIDESMWKDDVPESQDTTDIETGSKSYENVSSESEATILSLGSAESPTYYQYYVTVSIVSEIGSAS